MAANEWFRVGVVTQPHGLKGEVKVFPTTEDPERFEEGLKLKLRKGSEERDVTVRSARFFKNMVILGFEGYTDINQVETLRQAELYVSREDAIPLEEGEYYLADLMGMTVVNEKDASVLGTLTDVIQTGANDVYVVTGGAKEWLIPNIPSCILEVDVEAGRMLVHLLPGLEDL